MNSQLASLDVAVVILYLVGMIVLGGWFGRQQKNVTTYFVGDRNVSWWLVLVSIVATETSAVTFLSVPGVAFNREGGNLTFLQLSFGYVIGRVVIAWFLLPQYFHGELFSAYQLLHQRFNRAVQRTASGLFLATRTVADGLRLYLAALLLQQFTGWDGRTAILVSGAATLIYTYLGGMQAVIWTDFIQFIIYVGGALVAAAYVLRLTPDGWAGIQTVGDYTQKFQVLNFTFDLSTPYTFWAGVVGGSFFTMASHGADQLMVQRYLCSRSLTQARVALVMSGLVVLVQFLLFLLIGVGLYVLAFDGTMTVAPGTRNDEVFGLFIVRFLPPGVIGLVVAAVLAASMSTLSSSLNSSANAFVADFYSPLRPNVSDEHLMTVARVMTLIWGAAQVAVALAALALQSKRSIVDQVLTVAGFTTGMVLGLFILGSLRQPVGSTSALIGLVGGFLAVLAAWLPSFYGGTALAWPWYAPIGTIVTVIIATFADRFFGHGSSSHRSA